MTESTWKRILLGFRFAASSGREIAWGVADFVRQQGVTWELLTEDLAPLEALIEHYGPFDGAIVPSFNVPLRERLAAEGCPLVGALGALNPPEFPHVVDDQKAIGRLAYEHLRSCGFSRLAWCGQGEIDWSVQRVRSFTDAAKQDVVGRAVQLFELPGADVEDESHRGEFREQVGKVLSQLPGPVAVFAVSTRVAWLVAEACHEKHLEIPEQVGLLAAGQDDLNCELANPPLSVVDAGSQSVGFQAAVTLDQLLRGLPAKTGRVPILPSGVVARRSTDVLATEDALVRSALQFIREYASEGISVEDVVESVDVSRRMLERRFRRAMNRTLYQEITRVRIDRARQLLSRTSLSVLEVAARCGFSFTQQFNAAFKRTTDLTPAQYRDQTAPNAGRRR